MQNCWLREQQKGRRDAHCQRSKWGGARHDGHARRGAAATTQPDIQGFPAWMLRMSSLKRDQPRSAQLQLSFPLSLQPIPAQQLSTGLLITAKHQAYTPNLLPPPPSHSSLCSRATSPHPTRYKVLPFVQYFCSPFNPVLIVLYGLFLLVADPPRYPFGPRGLSSCTAIPPLSQLHPHPTCTVPHSPGFLCHKGLDSQLDCRLKDMTALVLQRPDAMPGFGSEMDDVQTPASR